MPIFVGLWTGVIEYSWLAYHYSCVAESVAEGCRRASLVDSGEGEVDAQEVIDTARAEIAAEYVEKAGACGAGCTATASLVNSRPHRSVRCALTAPYPELTGLLPAPSALSSVAVVRLEFQRGGS